MLPTRKQEVLNYCKRSSNAFIGISTSAWKRKKKWAEHTTFTTAMRNASKTVSGKPERKMSPERPRRR
jgi:hypothetical protein